jgi:hypothetical protein
LYQTENQSLQHLSHKRHPFCGHDVKQRVKKKITLSQKAAIWVAFFHPTKMNLSHRRAEQKRWAIWATARSFPPEEIQMGSYV